VAIYQQANQDLLHLLEPVPENKKVRDFLNGITDPQCSNIKLNVLANPIYMNDFALMINYCATAIDMIKKNDSTSCQISDVNSGNLRGNGRGGRNKINRGGRGGLGRGGRGHQGNNTDSNRGGRGGHGRGRGRGRGRNDPNDQLIGRGYSRDDWNNLSQAEKNRIYRARERFKTACTVAALLRDQHADSHADDLLTMVPSVVNLPPSQNGDQQQGRASSQVSQVSLASVGQSMNRCQGSIGAYNTRGRKECQLASLMQNNIADGIQTCRAELDSHADTCGVNNVALIVEHLGKVAEVHGFSKSMQAMQNIPIVKAALAYDDCITGETVILKINQALYFGDQLTHILLNQNQMRSNGLIVDDCPKHLSGGKSMHSITIEEHHLTIPLKLNGVMSSFNVRTPTKDELYNCQHIDITSPTVEWEPYSTQFEEAESRLSDYEDTRRELKSLDVLCDDFHDKIMRRTMAASKVSKTQLFVNSEELAKKWLVGLKVAQDTVKATTQHLIRNTIHPIER